MTKPYKRYEKPPLGIKPRYIIAEQRLLEIDEAIEKRLHSYHIIPLVWLEERNEIVAYLNRSVPRGESMVSNRLRETNVMEGIGNFFE